MGICDRCGEKGPVYECWKEGEIEMLCEGCSVHEEVYEWEDDGFLAVDDELDI